MEGGVRRNLPEIPSDTIYMEYILSGHEFLTKFLNNKSYSLEHLQLTLKNPAWTEYGREQIRENIKTRLIEIWREV